MTETFVDLGRSRENNEKDNNAICQLEFVNHVKNDQPQSQEAISDSGTCRRSWLDAFGREKNFRRFGAENTAYEVSQLK